jgi:hypothetical protein
MAISPRQFIKTSEFHQRNLQLLLEQYIDLPEAPGILASMLYIQQSINAARLAAEEDEKTNKKEKND